MLTINLLPEGTRKARPSALTQLHRIPLMRILVATMVGGALLLAVPIQYARGRLQRLNARLAVLAPAQAEVDRVKRLVQQLRAEQAAYEGMRPSHQLWAQRWSALSDVVPPGVWLTVLDLDDETLVIEGSAIGEHGTEVVGINRLVQQLKEADEWASLIQEVRVESMKRVQDGAVELVQFTLTCPLREAPR